MKLNCLARFRRSSNFIMCFESNTFCKKAKISLLLTKSFFGGEWAYLISTIWAMV
jgi:hypothetical protein